MNLLNFQDTVEALAPPDAVIRREVEMATVRLQEHTTYDDAREVAAPTHVRTATVVVGYSCLLAVISLVYVVARAADIGDLYVYEQNGGYSAYRIVVLFVELFYCVSAVYLLLARTKRPADLHVSFETSSPNTFVPVEILTILLCTDEDQHAIIQAVQNHYQAKRPKELKMKVVVVIEQETPGVKAAIVALRTRFPGVSLMSYEQLASQAFVVDPTAHTGGQLGEQAVEGVVVADDMSPGQVRSYSPHPRSPSWQDCRFCKVF